jgi:hypothetical protein
MVTVPFASSFGKYIVNLIYAIYINEIQLVLTAFVGHTALPKLPSTTITNTDYLHL